MKYTLIALLILAGCGKENAAPNISNEAVSSSTFCVQAGQVNGSSTFIFKYQTISYEDGGSLNLCSVVTSVGEFSGHFYAAAGTDSATNGTCQVGLLGGTLTYTNSPPKVDYSTDNSEVLFGEGCQTN